MPYGVLAVAAALGLAGAWIAAPDPARHGLRAVHSTGLVQVERVALVTANGPGLAADTVLDTTWNGYLFQSAPGPVTFRVPAGVDSRLTIGDQTVFAADRSSLPASGRAAVQLPAGLHPLRLEVTTPRGLEVYYQAGLEWLTPLGWRLTPPVYLYPDPVDPAQAAAAVSRWRLSLALAGLGAALGLGLGSRLIWTHRRRLASRTVLGLAALALLAFGLRMLILRDLAAPANADVFSLGSDHRSYQETALKVLRGTWKEGGYRVQPGMTLTLAGIYAVFGPDIRTAQALQMLLGSLMTGLVFDFARRTFGAPAGWAAAAAWAALAPGIFYEAQLLSHGLEAQAGLLVMWLWLRAWQGREWRWLLGLGLALGAAAVLRPTFLALAPIAAASLAWHRPFRWAPAAARTAVLAAVVLLPIAPITWRNYLVTGNFQLISANSDLTLYLGNNRDATGLGEYSPAYWETHARINRGETNYLRQTYLDIAGDPIRWLQLMVRKIALYLGDPEQPNNVDFYAEGTERSPLLAALPVRFGGLMALGLAGAALALGEAHRYRPGLWVLLIYAGLQIAVTVAYHVFSRFRAPTYPALVVLGGFAIAAALAPLRELNWRRAGPPLLALAAAGGFTAAMPWVADRVMSRPIVRDLPAGSQRLDAPIGDSLTLVGYDRLPAVEPGEPVFVTLYWQTDRPLATDLFATVQVLAGPDLGLKLTQADQAIGTGGFPDYPTTEWRPGQIVRDRYLLHLPGDAPAPSALTILAAAYHRDSGERVGERTFGPLPVTYAEAPDVPAEAQPVGAQIGSATLAAYRAQVDTLTLALTLYWTAGAPMGEDAVVFVHLLDAHGGLALGQDTRPRNGLYGTQAWQTGEGIVDEHLIPLPADLPPGEYRIAIGMYDSATQVRLPVKDANGQPAPDGVLWLGKIQR